MKWVFLLLSLLWVHKTLLGQNDTLIMKPDQILIGELKVFDEGLVKIETTYSDTDFMVEWDQVLYLSTKQKFVILTSKGKRYYGSLASDQNNLGTVIIYDKEEGEVSLKLDDIVYFDQVEDTFWSRSDLSLSLGFNKTKANSSTQLSINLEAGYTGRRFLSDTHFSVIRNVQTAEDITTLVERTEGGLGFILFIYEDWFAVTRADLLQSSEQLLKIRSIIKGGIGRYVLKNNRMNLGLATGVAWNFEDYEVASGQDRNSAEGFLAAEYNIFNLGDLELNTKVIAYPSFTEKGRFRTDFNFSVKYEFAFDLFFKVGYKVNYDNMPVAGGTSNDYVIETSIGWEL